MYFWDYGNAFLLEASRVGADVVNDDGRFGTLPMLKTSWGRFVLIMDSDRTDGCAPAATQ